MALLDGRGKATDVPLDAMRIWVQIQRLPYALKTEVMGWIMGKKLGTVVAVDHKNKKIVDEHLRVCVNLHHSSHISPPRLLEVVLKLDTLSNMKSSQTFASVVVCWEWNTQLRSFAACPRTNVQRLSPLTLRHCHYVEGEKHGAAVPVQPCACWIMLAHGVALLRAALGAAARPVLAGVGAASGDGGSSDIYRAGSCARWSALVAMEGNLQVRRPLKAAATEASKGTWKRTHKEVREEVEIVAYKAAVDKATGRKGGLLPAHVLATGIDLVFSFVNSSAESIGRMLYDDVSVSCKREWKL